MTRSTLAVISILVWANSIAAQAYPPRLTENQISEVKAGIAAMINDPRGPYARLRWFCADGTVHPPAGTPCREVGGGVQHAELSELARKFGPWGFNFGTVLQATPNDELIDRANNYYRLKELVVAQHLFEIDQGWVLRQARYYRGARQIEDEERRGSELLATLLSDTAWVDRNFLLAYQLGSVLPHERVTELEGTTRVRNLATELAQLDERLQPLRIKIHSLPSRDDLGAVDSLLAVPGRANEVVVKLTQLREELARQYDPQVVLATLNKYQEQLPTLREEIQAVQTARHAGVNRRTLDELARTASRARQLVTQSTNGRRNILLMDLIRTLNDQAFVVAQGLAGEGAQPRTTRVAWLNSYVTMAYATGFLSWREMSAQRDEITRLSSASRVSAMEYRNALAYINRTLEWGMATARTTFGGVHQHYMQVEPKANTFLDAMLRASPLLALSGELGQLASDADRVLGASHELFGRSVSQGARGLNPGVTMKQLEVVAADATEIHFEADKIYVLPQTSAELRPVAGVITLDEGNLLSHVQLLARNLGIPNAAVLPSFAADIRAYHGREVFYAVSPLGRVFLKEPSQLTSDERNLVSTRQVAPTTKIKLDVSKLDLTRDRPVDLGTLRATDAGVIVGPKAANLGQLAAYFPDKVAPGVALPFGMFYRHVNRPFEGGTTPLEALARSFATAASMRAQGRDAAEIDRFMFDALAQMRRAIQELEWLPSVRSAIVTAIQETFGNEVNRGVFVRSDTNVEDLPQFSGAGLNLTVANLVSVDDILSSIKRVWTSPFSERAFLWRKEVLDDQSEVYPSVLLLRSVPSEKSGVLITTGLGAGGANDLTIATAEGVGGAVDGEETETVVVSSGGRVRLLSQAKAPYRRVPVYTGQGGMSVVPANKPDVLLEPGEVAQLVQAVADWKRRFPDAESQVWDMEFGFVGGKLWLFQVRPFVRFRNTDLLARLDLLDQSLMSNANRQVSLGDPINE